MKNTSYHKNDSTLLYRFDLSPHLMRSLDSGYVCQNLHFAHFLTGSLVRHRNPKKAGILPTLSIPEKPDRKNINMFF